MKIQNQAGPRFAGRVVLLGLAVASVLFMSGCVTGRRFVSLPVPSLGAAPATKGDLYIGTVADQRLFENKPSQPSTPSIDGDVSSLGATGKEIFIGRQRNGYGHAMGDVALPTGDTVPQKVRALFEEAARHHGYQVAKDSTAARSADIEIAQFWAWFSPGFATVTFEAKIVCTVTLKQGGETKRVTIDGYGINHGQIASDENWQLAYTRAFTDFLMKCEPALTQAGW